MAGRKHQRMQKQFRTSLTESRKSIPQIIVSNICRQNNVMQNAIILHQLSHLVFLINLICFALVSKPYLLSPRVYYRTNFQSTLQ